MLIKRLVGICGAMWLSAAAFGAAVPSPVADAAMNRDTAALKTLVAQKADVNAAQADGTTALHWIARWGDLAAADVLIRAGAKAGAANRDGATPMFLASQAGNAAMIEKLIAAGADPNAPVLEHGETALMMAARSGDVAAVKMLLDHGAQVNARETLRGTTALMWAAEQGHAPVLKVLLDHGADLQAQSTVFTPVQAAGLGFARGGPPPGGAAPQAGGRGPGRGAAPQAAAGEAEDDSPAAQYAQAAAPQAPNGRAAGAAGGGRAAAAPGGGRAGAPAGAPGGGGRPARAPYKKGDMTALMFAVRQGEMDCVRLLTEAGAKIEEPAVDGSTPLLVAVQNGRYDVANYLLGRGANVNTPNEKGWTPLYLAVKSRDQEITSVPGPNNDGAFEFIQALLDHGADPNVRIKAATEVHQTMNSLWLKEEGATPLLRAALCGDLPLVKLLLAHKADPSIPTLDHTTPLMVAAGVGWSDGMLKEHSADETLELVKLLIDLGGDVNLANDHGITPLHGAAFKGANKVVQLLVDRGANLGAVDKGEDYGFGKSSVPMTPLDWATGVPIGMSSAIFHDDTVKLMVKLMNDRKIPVEFHSYHIAKSGDFAFGGAQTPQ